MLIPSTIILKTIELNVEKIIKLTLENVMPVA